MSKKIYTLDDLFTFCASNNLFSYDSNETGHKLSVQVPSFYEIDEGETNDSILYAKVKIFHTNTNRNHSNVTKEAAEKSLDGIKYKPLLANFCEIDGVRDFTSHDMEFNDDGTINYLEHQVGCFTSDTPYLEYDEENDRYYICASVAIPREYSDTAEIIERKGGTKVSAEIFVNKMSYDAQKKELLLEDIEVMGATCLGVDPNTGIEVQEGMEGARLDISDFSVESNSIKFEENNKLIETLEKLNSTLSRFNIQTDSVENSKKGGNDEVKIEELLKKYNKTLEDITFEYEGLADDELELAFEKAFAETVIMEDESAEESDGEAEVIEDPETEEIEAVEESEDEPEEIPVNDIVSVTEDNKKVECSVSFNGAMRSYSVSLNDTIYALQILVNDTYAESDNEYYFVDVFGDEKYVVMHGWAKSYRQSYKAEDDNYTLVGDREEVFAQWLSKEEIEAFNSMKKNYSSVSEELANFKAEPEKMDILTSTDYSRVNTTEEFSELMKQESHFNLSIDEVRAKADEILLKYAKNADFSFEPETEPKNVSKKTLAKTMKKPGRYGNLFSNK